MTKKNNNHGSINAQLGEMTVESIASPGDYEENESIPTDFFINECQRLGYSVKQVLEAIRAESIPLFSSNNRRFPPRGFLNENNLEDFLRNPNIKIFTLHADFFWRHNKPDHLGGWAGTKEKKPFINDPETEKIQESFRKRDKSPKEAQKRTQPERKEMAKRLKAEGKTRREIAEVLYPDEIERGYPKLDTLKRYVTKLVNE